MSETHQSDDTEAETHQPTLTCVECETEIHLGEERTHTTDGIHHLACMYARELRDTFHFFIGNTNQTDQVSMSMWYEDEDREYPVLQNRDGKNAILSASKKFGQDIAIQPTKHFAYAIAYTYHWLQSYRPLPHDHERILKEINDEMVKYYPNGKVPVHEEFAIRMIVSGLYQSRMVPPEWKSIVEFCDQCTAFSVPKVGPW